MYCDIGTSHYQQDQQGRFRRWTQFSIRDFGGNYLRRMVRPERFELQTFWS